MYNSEKIKNVHEHYILNPEEYFKQKGVWKNWNYFLGHDISKLIKTKNEWIDYCKKINILTIDDYKNACDKHNCLPKNPVDFYENEDFTNIQNELGLNKKRR